MRYKNIFGIAVAALMAMAGCNDAADERTPKRETLQACEMPLRFMAEHPELTLAEFRDLLGTSRKYALAVLEYYDKNKILKKDGDVRRLGTGF